MSFCKLPLLGLLILGPLVGCAALYPRFDNPLNPDIAFPNVGDVVDGVKCAVSSYLFERAAKVQAEQRILLEEEMVRKRKRDVDTRYCEHFDDYIHPNKWRIALLVPKNDGSGECHFDSILKSDQKKQLLPSDAERALQKKLDQGTQLTEAEEQTLLALSNQRLSFTWAGAGKCPPAGFKAYRYIKLSKAREGSWKKYICEPNGGCLAGTSPQRGGTCAGEDRSRFALDPNSNAKIELTISAVNTAGMNYTRIDATRLDFLAGIIVPGDSAKGFPFPTFKASDRMTNRVNLSVVMPQAVLEEAKKDRETEELISVLKRIDDLRRPTAYAAALERSREDADVNQLSREVLDELTKGHKEYDAKCKAYPLKVDFLALQRYITRIVVEQEEKVFGGPPQIALENLVLTSEFQLVFDATAGTQNLLRILPVLQPPVLSINPDHTHNLKITFAGAKSRALASGGTSLVQRCLSRFRNAPTQGEHPEVYCRKVEALHRESIIEAVESGGRGG